MAKKKLFEGAATALVTPFNANGVDYRSFARIIDFQINGGIDALVVCATTGECSTLSDEEKKQIIRFAVKYTNRRVPVIAGTGSNSTEHTIKLSREAQEAGADGILVVTPYYNKASPEGLVRHFTLVAESVDIPLIIYNVPSRTGLNIPVPVCKTLSEIKNIVGIKEAGSDIAHTARIAGACGENLYIYSGNDDRILPVLSLGGIGVISVLSNILPAQVHEMCALYTEGRCEDASALQLDLFPIVDCLFAEVNPIPVKWAMSKMGLCSSSLRLPLCEPQEATAVKLENEMRKLGLIK